MLNEIQKQAVRDAEILMVDGNELDAATEAAKLQRQSVQRIFMIAEEFLTESKNYWR